MKRRVGIFAGTFDPVHTGHIAFALQAIEKARLDEVIFVPERRPRHKLAPEHFAHRVAMLRRALRPHSKLSLLELNEAHLSVPRSLPHLRAATSSAQLVLLVGSDVVSSMQKWPELARLLSQTELVVGVRQGDSAEAVQLEIATWPIQPQALYVFDSYAPHVSSHTVRRAISAGRLAAGLLTSVRRYSHDNWLYVSFGGEL